MIAEGALLINSAPQEGVRTEPLELGRAFILAYAETSTRGVWATQKLKLLFTICGPRLRRRSRCRAESGRSTFYGGTRAVEQAPSARTRARRLDTYVSAADHPQPGQRNRDANVLARLLPVGHTGKSTRPTPIRPKQGAPKSAVVFKITAIDHSAVPPRQNCPEFCESGHRPGFDLPQCHWRCRCEEIRKALSSIL